MPPNSPLRPGEHAFAYESSPWANVPLPSGPVGNGLPPSVTVVADPSKRKNVKELSTFAAYGDARPPRDFLGTRVLTAVALAVWGLTGGLHLLTSPLWWVPFVAIVIVLPAIIYVRKKIAANTRRLHAKFWAEHTPIAPGLSNIMYVQVDRLSPEDLTSIQEGVHAFSAKEPEDRAQAEFDDLYDLIEVTLQRQSGPTRRS